jgi:hypothetical protein
VNLGKKEKKSTYVNDSSYEAEPTTFPSSYAKAVIQQCPDLQKLLVSTCHGFAKADIGQDPLGFFKVIRQSKALYCKIEYRAAD